jgi:hypothetical protein
MNGMMDEMQRQINIRMKVSVVLLGCDMVWTCRQIPEALKMETVYFSKMLVCTFKSMQCHSPEHQHLHHRKNLKSHLGMDGFGRM